MKTIAFAVLVVSLAAPALAADSKDAPKPKKPHMICKRDENTGSHMTKTICKTAEQWAGTSDTDDTDNLGTFTHPTAGGSGVATLSRDPPH